MGQASARRKLAAVAISPPLLKIDLGCGPHKREGFTGVDCLPFPGVDIVTDLRQRWPFDDNAVSEAHMSHALEHFAALGRCHIDNEL
jgi:predicted SAM-dependent methyltransferase